MTGQILTEKQAKKLKRYCLGFCSLEGYVEEKDLIKKILKSGIESNLNSASNMLKKLTGDEFYYGVSPFGFHFLKIERINRVTYKVSSEVY